MGPRNGSARVFSFSKNLATSCSALWGLGLIKSPHKPNLTRMVDVVKRRAQEHPCLFPDCTRMQRIRHRMHELLVLVFQQLANIAPFRFTGGFRRRKPIASFDDKRSAALSKQASAYHVLPVSRMNRELPNIVSSALRSPECHLSRNASQSLL